MNEKKLKMAEIEKEMRLRNIKEFKKENNFRKYVKCCVTCDHVTIWYGGGLDCKLMCSEVLPQSMCDKWEKLEDKLCPDCTNRVNKGSCSSCAFLYMSSECIMSSDCPTCPTCGGTWMVKK